MIRIPGLILLLTLPYFGHAQLTASNIDLLRSELAKRVNELRVSTGASPLEFNDTLKNAAQDHSIYMAKNDELTHKQKKSKSATPKKRVGLRGGKNFEIVGENVLYTVRQEFPLKKKDVIALAQQMFESWKNSPGHYANMINPEYTLGDFGFKTNTKKRIVYATQVFGRKGVKVPNQLSENTFRIKDGFPDCPDQFSSFSNIVANMGNSLKIEGNEVKFYHHNADYFDRIFGGLKDGIAVDIVTRDQVSCSGPNVLDFSPVHDGILMKPVYREDLLRNNCAQSDYRIITPVGTLPEHMVGKDISASIVLIKNGAFCKYLVPSYIPSEGYELRTIEPILNNPTGVELSSTGIVRSEELIYDFKSNKTKPLKYPDIPSHSNKVHSVTITSYSSVEGDSSKNALLHQSRAKTIQDHLVRKLNVSDADIRVNASENWNQMSFQLHYLKQEGLAALSHDSIRNRIPGDTLLPWDSLLHAQRRASAVINYVGEHSADGNPIALAEMNLRAAIASRNFNLANKALYEICKSSKPDADIFFETSVYDGLNEHPELVQNAAALLCLVRTRNLDKTTRFIFNWMYRANELSAEAKHNLLHLYTLIGTYLLDDWDVSAERLSNVMHPNKVNKLAQNLTINELVLNLQLTYIQYFGQVNDGENISKSFDFIADYFKTRSLSPEDDVDLVLFFNSWSMYKMTVKHLLPKFETDKLNEDGVFTLAQTMNFYKEIKETGQYESIHQKAHTLNKKRWCAWLYQDFQILRNHKIKQMYCEVCE
jgi:uncharacterized protein YkwD